MLQVLIRRHPRQIFLDKTVIFIHLHAVRIGQNVDVAAVTAGMLSDIHGRSDLQHRSLLLLTGIDICSQLRVAEHIHDPVIADPVTASEVFVGVVVEHAPAEASGNIGLTCHSIQYIGVADGMLTAALFVVEGLCGIHMPVVLTDQIRLLHIRCDFFLRITAGHLTVVQKIIIRIDIF